MGKSVSERKQQRINEAYKPSHPIQGIVILIMFATVAIGSAVTLAYEIIHGLLFNW